MKLPIFKYFFKSTLKSKFLLISSGVIGLTFLVILVIFTFSLQSNSSTLNASPSALRIILFVIGILQITVINTFVFAKYFSNSTKDGTMSLEIRSGISKTQMFFQRILLSKVWTVSWYLFFSLMIVIFAIASPSDPFKILLFNLSLGFIVVFLYDLFLTAILSFVSSFGSTVILGILSTLVLLLGVITPMVPELVRITDKTGLTNYTTQAYRDHETFLISNKVRNLAKKYEKLEHKSFTNTMLKSYVGLSEAIVKVRQYVPVDTPTTLEQKEIYAIALSGLLTEFSQGIIKQGVKYEYENEEEINRNPILKYLNNVKKLHDLGKEPYNFANHYGQNTWTKSFYYNKIGHGPNETFVFNFDSKFGFNNLIKEIPNKIENQEGYNMDEIKEFNEIINQIVKESFINFDARLPIDDIQNWTNWVFEVDNQANNKNEWLEYVNISIGARMYQTAFIKAINSPINLPLPNKNKDNSYPYTLDEYYEKVRVQLYANPWTMFDTILTSNYYGGDILGNKIAMTSMNQPWINDEIILKKNTAKPKKDEGDIFNSIDDGFAIELEIKGKIFNPFLAIGVYALIFIILIMVSYLTFRKTMKK